MISLTFTIIYGFRSPRVVMKFPLAGCLGRARAHFGLGHDANPDAVNIEIDI